MFPHYASHRKSSLESGMSEVVRSRSCKLYGADCEVECETPVSQEHFNSLRSL